MLDLEHNASGSTVLDLTELSGQVRFLMESTRMWTVVPSENLKYRREVQKSILVTSL